MFGDIDAGVTFTTPEITDNTISGFYAGIALEDGTSYNGLAGANIRGNTLKTNDHGLLVYSAGTEYTVACNSITGNTKWGLAVNEGYSSIVKAENNWWGDASGPAACAACNGVYPGDIGSVDFTPCLRVSPDKASQCGNFYWPMFLPAISHPH